jgi:bifunctional non-homologous end joining protein LigD
MPVRRTPAATASSRVSDARVSEARVSEARVSEALTHAHKVIDVSGGFTKLDLALYYAEAAPWLLPLLKGRPLYVRRAPSGVQGRMFFQQHPDQTREFRGTDPALWPGHDPAIAIETVEELLTAVQIGTIELHTWNSTAKAIAQPDRLIFDIDPGEGVAWPQVREAALLVRALLQELGLKSWLRTTGGKGLHVVVPMKPEVSYPMAKGFSFAVVRHLAKTIPERFVTKSGSSNRRGRIFIDFLRNGQSQSTNEAYSARARPGMGVSMPIAWEELPAVTRGDHWNIRTAVNRLRSLDEDPWAGFRKSRQRIVKAIELLGSEAMD